MSANLPRGQKNLTRFCEDSRLLWWVKLLKRAAAPPLIILFIGLRSSVVSQSKQGGQPEEQGKVHFTIREDEDDPAVWEVVNSFARSPSRENTRGAFKVLEEKLADWDSHPAGIATTILEAIGEHNIQQGRRYLAQFLQIDPTLKSADFVASSAARALGHLGGRSALEVLTDAANRWSPETLSSVAVALGILKDPRSVPTLENLARRQEESVRHRALSALAVYCSPSSRTLVAQALADAADRVRNSAIWWVASCGTSADAPLLLQGLRDADALVRANALKGLTRVGSKVACDRILPLLKDESLTVQERARAYQSVCEDP